MSYPTLTNDAPHTLADRLDLKRDLEQTRQLHGRLQERLVDAPELVRHVSDQTRRQLAGAGVRFEGDRELSAALSALVLRGTTVDSLRNIAETLHTIIERALDWVIGDPSRIERYFGCHRRMLPYFAKTPGLDSWQGYSRYDAVVTQDGRLQIIELNTCCPAGFLHMPFCTQATTSALRELEVLPDASEAGGAVEEGALVEGLLSIEKSSQIPPGLVALLNDENQLRNELDLLAEAFRARGRDVVIAGASELALVSERVLYDGRPVSLSYNKIRVSTAQSPNHCWKAGFEQRYHDFLEGIRCGTFVSVNNLVCATLGEDKTLLSVLRSPEFSSTLSVAQREFVDRFILWTVPLKPGPVHLDGKAIDLLPYVRRNRERFVLKPANEGRGFGVVIGKACDQQSWDAACAPQPSVPYVVQEFAAPATLPVPVSAEQQRVPTMVPMHLVIALAVVCGRYQGLFSRISPHLVTNVGRSGLIQAVCVIDD